MVLFFSSKPLFPLLLLLLGILLAFEEWISVPSCNVVPTIADRYDAANGDDAENLKVMMVADLLLMDSDSGFFNLHFRDYYLSRFFRKSFHSLKPDMLLVLGDVSARGSKLSKTKWISVLHQFHQMLGPFIELPFHVVVGDKDVGECGELDVKSVYWVSRRFPGLDSSGCGTFEIGNISFVSLNAVALLCGSNKLRFSVEKVIESESIDLRVEAEQGALKGTDESGQFREISDGFGWRENSMLSGSGPVLLLHFPLHRTGKDNCREGTIFEKGSDPLRQGSDALETRGFVSTGPYELSHTVPLNATKYIFQALKPRIIFSAHTHEFCDHTHSDGTREVTVPAMTWKVRDDPGFIVATFRSDRNAVSVSYCSLARESHVLLVYTFLMVLLLTMWLVVNTLPLRCLRR